MAVLICHSCLNTLSNHAQCFQWIWDEHNYGIVKMQDIVLKRVANGALVQHALLRMAVARLHVAEVGASTFACFVVCRAHFVCNRKITTCG